MRVDIMLRYSKCSARKNFCMEIHLHRCHRLLVGWFNAGQQMLELSCENATVGKNGLKYLQDYRGSSKNYSFRGSSFPIIVVVPRLSW